MRTVAVLASTTSAAFETPNAVRVDPCARQVDLDYVTYERGGGEQPRFGDLAKNCAIAVECRTRVLKIKARTLVVLKKLVK